MGSRIDSPPVNPCPPPDCRAKPVTRTILANRPKGVADRPNQTKSQTELTQRSGPDPASPAHGHVTSGGRPTVRQSESAQRRQVGRLGLLDCAAWPSAAELQRWPGAGGSRIRRKRFTNLTYSPLKCDEVTFYVSHTKHKHSRSRRFRKTSYNTHGCRFV